MPTPPAIYVVFLFVLYEALLETLLDQVDGLEKQLQEYRAENERDKASIRKRVIDAAEESERSESEDERE